MSLRRTIVWGSAAAAAGLCAYGCSDSAVVRGGLGIDLGDGGLNGSANGSGSDGGGSGSDGGGNVTVLPDGAVVTQGGSVGDACSDSEPCRPGLSCESDKCALGHSSEEGKPCTVAGECQDGLQCVGGACAPAGDGQEGDPCQTDQECESGLRCGLVGFAAQCVPEGSSDVGQSCDLSGDCYGGLVCGPSSACLPTPPGGVSLGLPSSPEITCAKETKDHVVAHFEVPGADGADPDADFFRLPFPNDVRSTGGTLDLDGFPTPGVSPLVGFDPVQIYIDALTATETAWGAYPTVLFRFSGPIDFGSFNFKDGKTPVQWVDVTDPQAPENAGVRWAAGTDGGKYVCHNWMGVRRPDGAPLEDGHTYAVFLTTDALADNGTAIERDDHLVAMLASSAPSDAVLADAYDAFAPLRAYLDAQSIPAGRILNASVITVGQTRSSMADLAAAVQAEDAPAASDWVKCGGGATSPCPQADGDRACGDPASDYDEYHALVELPIFQKGTAPYFDSGGGIDTSGAVRTEKVCMALTVPKGATPADGWPLVVYGHGTGGSFRSHIRPEVAGALATAPTPMAVLGYDAVEHGPRRGDSTESPNNLFFNFANPQAARGNPMQGAADVISAGRLAKTLTVPASVTGDADIGFDAAAILFFGHSQGSMHGSLGLPYSNDYVAAVLSGNGASLMHALLGKKQPVDISAAVPLLLGDFDSTFKLPLGEMHPVLSLVQQWIDPADPLNFGAAIGAEPVSGVTPKHVFQTFGLGDTFAPPRTLKTYAIAARLDEVEPDSSAAGSDPIDDNKGRKVPPLSGNVTVDTTDLTLGVRKYGPPDGSDGHFVVFDVPAANGDAVRFLSMAAGGEIPDIGE